MNRSLYVLCITPVATRNMSELEIEICQNLKTRNFHPGRFGGQMRWWPGIPSRTLQQILTQTLQLLCLFYSGYYRLNEYKFWYVCFGFL